MRLAGAGGRLFGSEFLRIREGGDFLAHLVGCRFIAIYVVVFIWARGAHSASFVVGHSAFLGAGVVLFAS